MNTVIIKYKNKKIVSIIWKLYKNIEKKTIESKWKKRIKWKMK
jgi:hypothetical protein